MRWPWPWPWPVQVQTGTTPVGWALECTQIYMTGIVTRGQTGVPRIILTGVRTQLLEFHSRYVACQPTAGSNTTVSQHMHPACTTPQVIHCIACRMSASDLSEVAELQVHGGQCGAVHLTSTSLRPLVLAALLLHIQQHRQVEAQAGGLCAHHSSGLRVNRLA
jgi:hypothetical protein